MPRRLLLQTVAALTLYAATAAAQEAGGLSVSGPGFGQLPLSTLPSGGFAGLPARAPKDVAAANPARARSATDQQAIAQIRGDAGFLAGFHNGQPLAASRQPPPDFGPSAGFTVVEAPLTINNQDSVVNLAVGNDNTSQQTVELPAAAARTDKQPANTTVDSAVNQASGTGNRADQRIERR